jgi:hypothetical protein
MGSCTPPHSLRCTVSALVFSIGALTVQVVSRAAPVDAGDVRGQFVLGSVPAALQEKPARAAYNWELENGVKEVMPAKLAANRELAVVLVGSAAAKGGEQVDAAISGGCLLPSTLVLRSGTTLRIRNEDEIGHELLADGLDGFSAEATSPGATRSMHLTKPGHWPIHDRLATHANAHLYVLPDLVASAKVESSGSFVFSEIPPGKYTLKVFRGSAELASKDIEVSDKPLQLEPLVASSPKQSQ